MELERKSFSSAVQLAPDEGKGIVRALVSVFGNVDRTGERVMPGAFKSSLQNRKPVGVWAHDWTKPIAKTLDATETPEGLVITGQFNLDTQAGAEAYSNLKFGLINEWSIGYRVVKESRGGERKEIRQLDELELFEFSPVLVGMNPATRLLSIKAETDGGTTAMSGQEAVEAKELIESSEYKEWLAIRNKPVYTVPFQGAGGFGPGGFPGGGRWNEQKSYAQRFVESAEYKNWVGSHSANSDSQSVTFGDVSLKTLMSTTTGWVPESTRSGLVVPFATRPIMITDVIPTIGSLQNSYVYMEHTTFTNAAAETAEGASKPEGALALTEKTTPIRKIPVHIPVTDEQLEDVPGIQMWIENQLSFMVRQRLDSQIINGDGTGVNLLGILATPSVQTQAKGADPSPDAIYKAMTKVRVTGRAIPTAVVVHPNDWQKIKLLRESTGLYIWGHPAASGPDSIWGLPVVQTDALPEGTAIVADFSNYTLLVERNSMTIKIGWTGDQFITNTRTILAEIRVGFVVTRPTAVCLVTGLNA